MIRVIPDYKCISFLMPKTTCVNNKVCKKYCYLNKNPYPQAILDELKRERLETKSAKELFDDWSLQFIKFLNIYEKSSASKSNAGRFRVVFHTMGDFPTNSVNYLFAVEKLVNTFELDFDFVVFTRHDPSSFSFLPVWERLDSKVKMWLSVDGANDYNPCTDGWKGGIAQRKDEKNLNVKNIGWGTTCDCCDIFGEIPCLTQKDYIVLMEPPNESVIDVKLSDVKLSDFNGLYKKRKKRQDTIEWMTYCRGCGGWWTKGEPTKGCVHTGSKGEGDAVVVNCDEKERQDEETD